MRKLLTFFIGISMLLSGCQLTTNVPFTDDEKAEIYIEYLKKLPDMIVENSYYTYDIQDKNDSLYYQFYNRDGYKQYVFTGNQINDGFMLDIDDQYAYIYIDILKEEGNVIRTETNDSILNLVKEYEIDITEFMNNMEFVSLETTATLSKSQYYLDSVNLKTKLDDQEYDGTGTFYINDQKDVKIHETMDILLDGTFENNDRSLGMIIYAKKDVQNEREELEYIDVSSDEFIQTFHTEIEKL